jgi:MFS family permease
VDRRTTIVVFLVALAFCALLTKSHVTSWSDQSRVATVDALTSNNTFGIGGSPFAGRLGDEITYRGKTYSDKPPLLSLLATAVVLVAAPFGVSLRQTPAAAIYVMTLFTVGVWFAIGCAYAFAFARLLGFARRIAIAVAALTGAATLALPYAIVLTNHVPCGAAGLAGCYHLVRARNGATAHAALAGLFFALAFAFDPAGILLTIAGAVLLWGQPVRRWFAAVAAGVPVVALQMAYNLHVSGSALPTAFTGSVWKTAPIPSWATEPQPFVLHSLGDYAGFALNVLIGGKGLLTYTPLVLVAAYGLGVMWRSGGVMRRLALAVVATTAVFVVMIVTLQNQDAQAQNFGERRYVDIFFVLCVALGPALASVRNRIAAAAVLVCVAISVTIAALGTVAPFGGERGEGGFSYASAAFVALYHRSPVQAAIDVLLLIVLIVALVRLVQFPRLRRDGVASAVSSIV